MTADIKRQVEHGPHEPILGIAIRGTNELTPDDIRKTGRIANHSIPLGKHGEQTERSAPNTWQPTEVNNLVKRLKQIADRNGADILELDMSEVKNWYELADQLGPIHLTVYSKALDDEIGYSTPKIVFSNVILPEVPNVLGVRNDTLNVDRYNEAAMAGLRVNAMMPHAEKLKTDGETDGVTIDNLKDFIVRIAPYIHPKVFSDYPAHILATSIAMGIVSDQIDGLDSEKARIYGILHDLGALLYPNHYLKKNLIQETLEKALGLLKLLNGTEDPVPAILGIGTKKINSIDDMTPQQIIEDVMDNLMKIEPEDKIRSLARFLSQTANRSKQKAVYGERNYTWPSTQRGMYEMHENGAIDRAAGLVKDEMIWLTDHGVDIDLLTAKVQDELDSPENRAWLLKVRNAQETLDPGVDKELGRKPVEKVAFDLGGVLLDVNDDDLVVSLSERLNVPIGKVKEAFSELNNQDSYSGEMSLEQYIQRFKEITGPENVSRSDFEFPEIYRAMGGMQDLVSRLGDKGVEIWVYSNVIPALKGVVLEMVNELYPDIDQDRIIFSCESGLPKQDGSSYEVVANKIGAQPDQILFVDDVVRYTTLARASEFMRAFTYREGFDDKGERINSFERLTLELEKADLI